MKMSNMAYLLRKSKANLKVSKIDLKLNANIVNDFSMKKQNFYMIC